jgi:uncharacterized cupredoxin-like copper-binding protein
LNKCDFGENLLPDYTPLGRDRNQGDFYSFNNDSNEKENSERNFVDAPASNSDGLGVNALNSGNRSNEDNNNNDDDNGGSPGSSSSNTSKDRNLSPYTFNGRVIIGIGIILAVSAASSILASSISQSPEIHPALKTSVPLAILHSASGQTEKKQQQQSSITSGNTGSTSPIKNFVLVAHDFGWNGTNSGPTIQVAKGDHVQLTVINEGHMAHNFGIAKISDNTAQLLNKIQSLPLESRVASIPYNTMAVMPCPGCDKKFEEGHIETFILPDHQAVTSFTASEAGHFKYFCMVRGHIWLGMMGDFIVVDNPSAADIAKGGQG